MRFPAENLRDCATALQPMYANRFGIWDDRHSNTSAELRDRLQQITLHEAPPNITIKRERALIVTAIDQVTYSNESGGRGGWVAGQGRGWGRGRGRLDAKPSGESHRTAWRIMNHGADREKWDGAPTSDLIMKAFELLQSSSKHQEGHSVIGVQINSTAPLFPPPPPLTQ